MHNNKIIIILLCIFSIIFITVGVTLSFFNYAKTGTTDNTVKTGSITFLYTEVSGVGKGISLTEAYPVADSIGKVQIGEGKVFDFKVTSTIEMNSNIEYQVTARKKSDSTLANNAVKLYLTEDNGTEQELLLSKFSELSQTDKIDSSKYDERILYEATVPANIKNYEKNFKLRMWVSDDTDFTDGSMNDKTFTITVNVYADGKVITDSNKSDVASSINVLGESFDVIKTEPTLTTSSNNTSDASGLYASTATNTGKPTYYFRGNVENNYVSFAGFIWRIVRINEDGTIRIITQDGINSNTQYRFSNPGISYYTDSQAKPTIESWYQENIGKNANLSSKVATGDYFCEEAKVSYNSEFISISDSMVAYDEYTPNFKCKTDSNNKGIVNATVGLITTDEVIFAGGSRATKNSQYYLYNNEKSFWTMSAAGEANSFSWIWYIAWDETPLTYMPCFYPLSAFRVVLNLNTNVIASGDGTKANPFVIS